MTSRPRRDTGRRRTAFVFGLRAERRAALRLTLKGYRILASRYTAAGGEIDLVAKRGQVVAFVEVKARPTLDEAAASITGVKRERLHRAARRWLAHHPWAARDHVLRGDAVFVAPRRWPRHLADAFAIDLP